ncbi:hypothetical protein CDAR_37711 [Caerostris darwini]|uniref:Uncharacterized protein n=1 Tax=Caerostris darwini TaxID=1538125 RepID=A0AAV4V856_9ARAC|nr:hypothetical protein CDAR_37711 [Caerostris darwini]
MKRRIALRNLDITACPANNSICPLQRSIGAKGHRKDWASVGMPHLRTAQCGCSIKSPMFCTLEISSSSGGMA